MHQIVSEPRNTWRSHISLSAARSATLKQAESILAPTGGTEPSQQGLGKLRDQSFTYPISRTLMRAWEYAQFFPASRLYGHSVAEGKARMMLMVEVRSRYNREVLASLLG